jgi:hypothetical protein
MGEQDLQQSYVELLITLQYPLGTPRASGPQVATTALRFSLTQEYFVQVRLKSKENS